MEKLKGLVTRYFKQRGYAVRRTRGRAVRDNDNFFELYVLARLIDLLDARDFQNTGGGRGGTKVFQVATSPSSIWSDYSYVRVKAARGRRVFAIRTGIEVQTSPKAAAELDVAILALERIAGNRVPRDAAATGIECKHHSKKLSVTIADGVIGKSRRIWRRLPLAPVGSAERMALVSASDLTAGAREALRGEGIAAVIAYSADLENYLRRLIAGLRLAVPSRKARVVSTKASAP